MGVEPELWGSNRDKRSKRQLKQQGSTTTRYAYAGPSLLHEQTGTTKRDYIYLRGEIVGMVKNGVLYFVHNDHIGRPEFVTNSAKTIVWSSQNNAFDNVPAIDSVGGMHVGFPGQYYDQETGLHYNYFRTYDPSTGRYLESDPIGLAGGLNTYGYVGGNPLSYFDPYGLRPLTAREKCLLSPYIPEEDLENADLQDGKVPWYLRKKFDGITRGNKIFFREGVYDANTVAGIALLGHELVHVGQYREGMTWLKYLRSTRKGYYPSKYETPAYDLQWKIQRELTEEDVKECDPCEQ